MPRFDRLATAQRAIAIFTPQIKQSGVYNRAEPRRPAYWDLNLGTHRMLVTENALRLETDASTSNILDIWVTGVGKILSVSWEPERPWQPLHISSFKGEFIQELLSTATAEKA